MTWDDPALDKLFRELRINFEIEMRVSNVEKKLNLVVESAEILVDLTKSRREHALEIVVIVLIALRSCCRSSFSTTEISVLSGSVAG